MTTLKPRLAWNLRPLSIVAVGPYRRVLVWLVLVGDS